VLAAGNFAITAVLLQRFAEMAARQIPQWEIIDYGKAAKPDAPSGTARELASRLGRVGAPRVEVPVAETHGCRRRAGRTSRHARALRCGCRLRLLDRGPLRPPDERLSIRHDSGSGAGPYVAGTLLAIRRVGRSPARSAASTR
jgi:4-hydroxy-tetrahydrodipicolinate reductase